MRYFVVGRKYDKFYRLIKVKQYKHHIEIGLQVQEKHYLENAKLAEKTALMIAKAFGIVKLTKKSEIMEHHTGKKIIAFDENNYVSEVDEILYYQFFFYNRTVRPKKRPKNSGKR